MSDEKYLGMKQGDLEGKPYAKYWNPEMGPMQDHVQRALTHGIELQNWAFPLLKPTSFSSPGICF